MKRLFVAIPISEEIKAKIKPIINSLSNIGAEVNPVSLDNLHCTIKFLGSVEENKVNEIIEIVSAIATEQSSFSIKIQNVGVFPSYEQIKVVWIGAESPKMVLLIKKINHSLIHIRKEDREEIPHFTIARIKSGKNKELLKKYLQTIQNQEFGEMMVNKMMLYESELTPQGSRYRILSEFNLP